MTTKRLRDIDLPGDSAQPAFAEAGPQASDVSYKLREPEPAHP